MSIAYWRISNIIISKTLLLADVAHLEISFRVFAIAQIITAHCIHVGISGVGATVLKTGSQTGFQNYYSKVFNYYLLFGLFTYTFIFSFADTLIPWAFGSYHMCTGTYTKEMFLTILIFPTALLQANVLVTKNKERADMWFNVISSDPECDLLFLGSCLLRILQR